MEALFPTDPARRRRIARGLALLAIALAILLVARAMRKQGGVMELNRAFGERFLDGLDPWFDPERGHRVHGPYPPSLAWVAVPLSLLPLQLARAVWAMAQIGALVALFHLLRRRARDSFPEAEPHVPVLFAASLLLASRFLLRDMAGGGGNLIYATLAFAGVDAALRGRTLGAGVCLGWSLVLKPNLAPLFLFLLVRKRFRAATCALGFAAVLFWLPGLHFGLARYGELAREWAGGVARYAALEDLHTKDLVPEGLPGATDGMNQSLREAVQRVVRPPGDSGAVDVHVVELSPSAAAWTARVLSLALLAWVALVAWRARGPRGEWLAMLAFFPLALLISPITWKAHHAALVPVFFGLCCWAFDEAGRARARGWVVFLAIYWVACDLLSEEIAGKEAKRALQAMSVVTWFDVALIGALALAAARERASPSAPPRASIPA